MSLRHVLLLSLAITVTVGCADEQKSSTPPPRSTALTLRSSLETRRSDGRTGFNGDIWLHRNFAYLGTWGTSSSCPGSSVKVVDLTTVTAPRQVATLAEYADTTSEDVVVATVATPFFTGDLLATGLQQCNARGLGAVDLWDVTTPSAPRHLALLDIVASGNRVGNIDQTLHSPSPDGEHEEHATIRGVHELHIEVRGDQVLLYLAVPGGEAGSDQAGMLIVDASNPTAPAIIGSFGLPRDRGEAVGPSDFVHSVRVNPATKIVYLAYWDKGVVLVDVADPRSPRYIGRTTFPAEAEGNAHSVAFAQGGRLLLQCDEDFGPNATGSLEAGSGYLRVFDQTNLTSPVPLGTFRTANSRLAAPPAGTWTIHNVEVIGNTVYASWYSDGIVAIDIATPSSPNEIARYTPPSRPDPFGVFATAANVWGVATDGTLVVASDMNSGLYVLSP